MIALSIRQPWAWAILHAGKDIENRTWHPPAWLVGRRFLIHASKGCTRAEYEDAADDIYLVTRNVVPSLSELDRGGIVGAVTLARVVTDSESPWFGGAVGFVLTNPKPVPFVPCNGQLGFFRVPTDVADTLRGLRP